MYRLSKVLGHVSIPFPSATTTSAVKTASARYSVVVIGDKTRWFVKPLLEKMPKTVKLSGVGNKLEDFGEGVLANADILLYTYDPTAWAQLWPHFRNLKWFARVLLPMFIASLCRVHSYSAGVERILKDLRKSSAVLTNAKVCLLRVLVLCSCPVQGVYGEALGEWVLFSCLYFARRGHAHLVNQQVTCHWRYLLRLH